MGTHKQGTAASRRIRLKRWIVAEVDEQGHIKDGDWLVTDDYKIALMASVQHPDLVLIKTRLDYREES
jgi:hypothetical protein